MVNGHHNGVNGDSVGVNGDSVGVNGDSMGVNGDGVGVNGEGCSGDEVTPEDTEPSDALYKVRGRVRSVTRQLHVLGNSHSRDFTGG